MEALSVLEGRLKDPYTILAQGNEYPVKEWKPKAAWQFLRLTLGYREADQRIKQYAEEYLAELSEEERKNRSAAVELLKASSIENKEPLQFIMSSNQVVAVATLKHLLVPPSQVYTMVQKVLGAESMQDVRYVDGSVFKLEEQYGLEKGIQVVAGDLITNKAIKVSGFVRIVQCLNPLSWIGIGVFERFMGYASGWERIVRIKVISELEPRLTNAINNVKANFPKIDDKIERAKKRRVPLCDAEMFTVAFGYSYSLGAKTLRQVLERFESEDKTLFGLAQAFSWVAAHSDKLRKTPEGLESHARQKLSTIAGAFLLMDDYKAAREHTLDWLKAHIRSGRLETYEDLLKHAKKIP